MQQNNKLLLNSEEDPYIFAHNSSLVDRDFRLKFTSNAPHKPEPDANHDFSRLDDSTAIYGDDQARLLEIVHAPEESS